jgi:hypothetical protein
LTGGPKPGSEGDKQRVLTNPQRTPASGE